MYAGEGSGEQRTRGVLRAVQEVAVWIEWPGKIARIENQKTTGNRWDRCERYSRPKHCKRGDLSKLS